MDDKVAKTLRALQKLPSNKRCFNCDALGPSYVVPQFSIFVCTDCSGIHMHTGHRVKSIAMAKFTPDEVKKLQQGGNEHAARSYLARWKPETDTQKPVDRNAKRVQQWIKIIFTDKAYYSEVTAAPAPAELEPPKLEEPPKLAAPVSTAAPLNRTSPPAPATPPAQKETPQHQSVQNLLDFGPDPEPAPKAPGAAASSSAPDPFDPFAAPPAPAPAAAPAANAFDPFGNTQGGSAASAAAAFDPFSTGAAAPAPAPAPGFDASFDPFNNAPAAPWSSPAPAPAAPAAPPAAAWNVFDGAPAFPPPAAQPFGAASAFPPQPPAVATGSVSSSASATPTAAAAAAGFGQNGFATGGGWGPGPAGQPGLTSPLQSGNAEAAFASSAFPTSSSSAPVTPTSGPPASRGELPTDLFAESAFPNAMPYGGMPPPGSMGFGGMPQPGFPGAPFGHGMPPHQQGFLPHGMPQMGFMPGQVMPGMHNFPPPAMGGYTRQNTGPAAFGGGPPAPVGFQGPAPGMGMDASFFPHQAAPFPGHPQAHAFAAPGAYGAPAPPQYGQSAPAAPAQPSYGMPAPAPAPAPAAKKEEDSFADLLGGLNLKAQPKSSGPSTPNYGSSAPFGFGAAPAASGNPFA